MSRFGCGCLDRDPLWCHVRRDGGVDDMARARAYQDALEEPCECVCHEHEPSDDGYEEEDAYARA